MGDDRSGDLARNAVFARLKAEDARLERNRQRAMAIKKENHILDINLECKNVSVLPKVLQEISEIVDKYNKTGCDIQPNYNLK